jgi:hypothetical protein
MELEGADHLHLCDKESSAEGSERSIGDFLVHPLNQNTQLTSACVFV